MQYGFYGKYQWEIYYLGFWDLGVRLCYLNQENVYFWEIVFVVLLDIGRDRMFEYGVLSSNVFRIVYYELDFVGFVKL